MSKLEQWQNVNEQYLAAMLKWLRLCLLKMGRSEAEHKLPCFPDENPTDEAIAEAKEAMVNIIIEANKHGFLPSLLILSRHFGLSIFEQEVLSLCAAMELDTRIPALCAKAQHNTNKPYPTFALAMSMFKHASWDVLSWERPLLFWRLLEVNQATAEPLTSSALHVDIRIVNYIKGLNTLDNRLLFLLAPLQVDLSLLESGLPVSQHRMVEKIIHPIQRTVGKHAACVIQLVGSDVTSKQLLAQYAAHLLKMPIYRLPVEFLPSQLNELEMLAKLWDRELMLMHSMILYVDTNEIVNEQQLDLLKRFLNRTHSICLVDTREMRHDLNQDGVAVDISNPNGQEQRAIWAEVLGDEAGNTPELLAGQFNLDVNAIRQIANEAKSHPTAEQSAHNGVHDEVWEACLSRTRPRMDALAQRIDTKATWDDIVLADKEMALLRQIADQVRHRTVVYEDWGFARKMNRGLGINALFAGESGTGKTMAAEVIANELKLNLYRIDLSQVVSKYIGETEKNLRRLFDAAEDGGAILFFDEADALFGKRSEVKDSHDRYANIEINYLLQRMESYRGLAILATNMKNALDKAFMRRLRFILNFPFPGATERKRIWQKVFPPETPLLQLDYGRLAHLSLTGGDIYSASINAAFMAAQNDTAVTMPLVLAAARAEYRKLERPVNEADFRWTEPLEAAL